MLHFILHTENKYSEPVISLSIISVYMLIFCGSGYLSQYFDSLLARLSGDRIPVGTRFFPPIQTGRGAQPASYTVGSGSFSELKRPGRGVDRIRSSVDEVKEREELCLLRPPRLHGLAVLG